MPTLDDLKRMFREGALEPEEPVQANTTQYKIAKDGRDALLKFGRYRGKPLSVIAKSDPSYLRFIMTNDFPSELKDVARYLREQERTVEPKPLRLKKDGLPEVEVDVEDLFK